MNGFLPAITSIQKTSITTIETATLPRYNGDNNCAIDKETGGALPEYLRVWKEKVSELSNLDRLLALVTTGDLYFFYAHCLISISL